MAIREPSGMMTPLQPTCREQAIFPQEVWQRILLYSDQCTLADVAVVSKYFTQALKEDAKLNAMVRNESRLIRWSHFQGEFRKDTRTMGHSIDMMAPPDNGSNPKAFEFPPEGVTFACRFKVTGWTRGGRCALFSNWEWNRWCFVAFAMKSGPTVELRRDMVTSGSNGKQGLISCSAKWPEGKDYPLDEWAAVVWVWLPGKREMTCYCSLDSQPLEQMVVQTTPVRPEVKNVRVMNCVQEVKNFRVATYQGENMEGAISDVVVFQRPLGEKEEVLELVQKLRSVGPCPIVPSAKGEDTDELPHWSYLCPSSFTAQPAAIVVDQRHYASKADVETGIPPNRKTFDDNGDIPPPQRQRRAAAKSKR